MLKPFGLNSGKSLEFTRDKVSVVQVHFESNGSAYSCACLFRSMGGSLRADGTILISRRAIKINLN